MGRSRYKVYEECFPYFITSSIVEGIPLFANSNLAEMVLQAVVFLQKKRKVEVNAYVIMENHIHLIAKGKDLSEHFRNFKSYTAHQMIRYLTQANNEYLLSQLKRAKKAHKSGSMHQLWQEGAHPKQIFDHSVMSQKIEYIHYNPVIRGYVDRAEHWRYSSARNYLGEEGLIPVTLFRG
ncbi:MAG: transposase [Gracilimonas sp.]|nr:transposase [Gracilimonas sp.]